MNKISSLIICFSLCKLKNRYFPVKFLDLHLKLEYFLFIILCNSCIVLNVLIFKSSILLLKFFNLYIEGLNLCRRLSPLHFVIL